MLRKTLLLVLAFMLLPLGTAQAQDTTPIRIIVGYAAGGTTDILARFFANRLGPELGRPVIVENRPGGATLIANRAVATARPDGTTYLLGAMSSTIFRELMYNDRRRGYSMLTDLAPVATLSSHPMGIAVDGSLGIENAQDLVTWLKANPDQGVYGSSSLGSHSHLLGVLFGEAAGLNLEIIPYKGNSEIITALLSSQLPMAVLSAPDLKAQLGDRIKVVGTFTSERSDLLPGVPTLVEQGLEALGGDAWMGLWAPAKTPEPQLSAMQQAIAKVLADPEAIEALRSTFSAEPFLLVGDEMDKRQREELDMWREIIERSGFTPES